MAVLSPKKTDVSNFDEEQNDVQSFRKEKFRLHQITRTQSLSSGARESHKIVFLTYFGKERVGVRALERGCV